MLGSHSTGSGARSALSGSIETSSSVTRPGPFQKTLISNSAFARSSAWPGGAENGIVKLDRHDRRLAHFLLRPARQALAGPGADALLGEITGLGDPPRVRDHIRQLSAQARSDVAEEKKS
jgi:hypothetical protein